MLRTGLGSFDSISNFETCLGEALPTFLESRALNRFVKNSISTGFNAKKSLTLDPVLPIGAWDMGAWTPKPVGFPPPCDEPYMIEQTRTKYLKSMSQYTRFQKFSEGPSTPMNRLWILALLLGMCCASTIPSVEFHDVNGGTTTYESSVPRGSCTTLAAVIADPGLEIFLEYGKCVSYTSLYGIGFLLAAFVTLALNKYFRLLKRSHGSWTTTQKRVLVAIMLSMAFLAGSLGATGEAYSSSMQSATVDDSTGVLVLMNTFLQHSFTFFNAVLKALFAMLDSVIFAIDYIGFILFDAPVILDTIIDDVFDQFDEIGVLLIENSSFTANGQEFECPTCREVGAQSQEARTEYEVEVVPIVEALLGDRIELTEYLVDNKKKIKLGSSRVLEYADLSLDIAQNNWNEAYISINPIWKDAEKTRSTVVTVLFLVPIFVVVFVTLAALAASARLSKCSQNFIWTSWCIVSLCIAIHIPLLLFISDSCVVINDYESDFQGDDSPQAISYRVCVGNEDPDIFFNLSDVLEFRNRVDLTSLDSLDITSNEDLVEFRKTVSDFEELTLDSFGIDTEKVDDQLHLFNTDLDYSPASATYTWETIEFADVIVPL